MQFYSNCQFKIHKMRKFSPPTQLFLERSASKSFSKVLEESAKKKKSKREAPSNLIVVQLLIWIHKARRKKLHEMPNRITFHSRFCLLLYSNSERERAETNNVFHPRTSPWRLHGKRRCFFLSDIVIAFVCLFSHNQRSSRSTAEPEIIRNDVESSRKDYSRRKPVAIPPPDMEKYSHLCHKICHQQLPFPPFHRMLIKQRYRLIISVFRLKYIIARIGTTTNTRYPLSLSLRLGLLVRDERRSEFICWYGASYHLHLGQSNKTRLRYGPIFSAPRSFWASDSYVDSFIRGRARKAIKPNVNKRINNKYKSHKNRIFESNEKIMRRNGGFHRLNGSRIWMSTQLWKQPMLLAQGNLSIASHFPCDKYVEKSL